MSDDAGQHIDGDDQAGSDDASTDVLDVEVDEVTVGDADVAIDEITVDAVDPDEGLDDDGAHAVDDDAADATATGDEHIAYDLAEWAGESRAMLRQLLEADEVVHAWEGTTLVVPETMEEATDELVEQVEVTTLPTLDPDVEAIAYDLTDWSDEQLTLLQGKLQEAGIPYEFDANGDLVSTEDHQDPLEAFIDEVEFPDGSAPVAGRDDADDDRSAEDGDDDLDGEDEEVGDLDPASDDLDGDGMPDGAEVLSDLFIAADRLMHSARDHEGVLAMASAADAAERVALPYGFDPEVWAAIVRRAIDLRIALEGDDAEGEEAVAADADIEEQAKALRAALREYV